MIQNNFLVPERKCELCSSYFVPEARGFNAKYCSKKCRNKAAKLRITPEVKVLNRKRAYLKVKDNPERYAKHLTEGADNKKTVRMWLAEYKTSRGCIDCGYNHHSSALQLDHEGVKTAEISNLRSSKERILAEIESGKCVVRCAVCHSVKTWAEKNGLVYHPNMARGSISESIVKDN